jgi:hypothetical protein
MGDIPRRDFLRLAGGMILGAATRARGAHPPYDPNAGGPEPTDLDRYDFILPRVRVVELPFRGRGKGPDIWNVRPGGDANLLRELANVVRCRVKPIEGTIDWEPQYAREGQFNAVVTFDEPDLFRRYPFLFMTGENQYEFTTEQKHNCKDFLTAGGFLLIDDCVVGSGGDFFYTASYLWLEELFGQGAVQMIPREHEVFHNVFDLGATGLPTLQYIRRRGPGGLMFTHGQNHGARGLFLGDRLAVFLSSSDLHCGWCDSHGIEWGLDGYRKTIQMGINIITYALTH